MRSLKHPRLDQVQLTDVMYALSDPARVYIVRRLARAGEPLSCGQITGDRPKSSMSHHFKVLRASGILETVVEGTEHRNVLRSSELEQRFPGVMKAVLRALER
jgi:DNA-binding transcriptional ArsR family regulator